MKLVNLPPGFLRLIGALLHLPCRFISLLRLLLHLLQPALGVLFESLDSLHGLLGFRQQFTDAGTAENVVGHGRFFWFNS